MAARGSSSVIDQAQVEADAEAMAWAASAPMPSSAKRRDVRSGGRITSALPPFTSAPPASTASWRRAEQVTPRLLRIPAHPGELESA
jgi:hypothetical protein